MMYLRDWSFWNECRTALAIVRANCSVFPVVVLPELLYSSRLTGAHYCEANRPEGKQFTCMVD